MIYSNVVMKMLKCKNENLMTSHFNTLYFVYPTSSYEFDDPRLQFFIEMNKEAFEIIGQGFAADFVPIAKYIPTPGLRSFLKIMDSYNGRIQQYFKEHRETYDPG